VVPGPSPLCGGAELSESLIVSHHSRFTCECDKEEIDDEDDHGAELRVEGAGLRVQGLWFRVQGSGFRVQGSGFKVSGSRFRV